MTVNVVTKTDATLTTASVGLNVFGTRTTPVSPDLSVVCWATSNLSPVFFHAGVVNHPLGGAGFASGDELIPTPTGQGFPVNLAYLGSDTMCLFSWRQAFPGPAGWSVTLFTVGPTGPLLIGSPQTVLPDENNQCTNGYVLPIGPALADIIFTDTAPSTTTIKAGSFTWGGVGVTSTSTVTDLGLPVSLLIDAQIINGASDIMVLWALEGAGSTWVLHCTTFTSAFSLISDVILPTESVINNGFNTGLGIQLVPGGALVFVQPEQASFQPGVTRVWWDFFFVQLSGGAIVSATPDPGNGGTYGEELLGSPFGQRQITAVPLTAGSYVAFPGKNLNPAYTGPEQGGLWGLYQVDPSTHQLGVNNLAPLDPSNANTVFGFPATNQNGSSMRTLPYPTHPFRYAGEVTETSTTIRLVENQIGGAGGEAGFNPILGRIRMGADQGIGAGNNATGVGAFLGGLRDHSTLPTYAGLPNKVTIVRTLDEVTWTEIGSGQGGDNPTLDNVNCMVRAGDFYLAAGQLNDSAPAAQTLNLFESSHGGLAWTAQPMPPGIPTVGGIVQAFVNSVTFDGSRWAAIGFATGGTGGRSLVFLSADGQTWTVHDYDHKTLGFTISQTYGKTIAGSGGLWVAGMLTTRYDGSGNFVSSVGGPAIATSPDGVTWTKRTTPADPVTIAVLSVAWNGSVFIALLAPVGADSTIGSGPGFALAMTSTDGITWSPQDTPFNNVFFHAVTWGNGVFVAVGDYVTGHSGPTIMSSPDGVTWTARTTPNDAVTWYDVTWDQAAQKFLAYGIATNFSAGSGFAWIGESPDGATWTNTSIGGINPDGQIVFNPANMIQIVGGNLP